MDLIVSVRILQGVPTKQVLSIHFANNAAFWFLVAPSRKCSVQDRIRRFSCLTKQLMLSLKNSLSPQTILQSETGTLWLTVQESRHTAPLRQSCKRAFRRKNSGKPNGSSKKEMRRSKAVHNDIFWVKDAVRHRIQQHSSEASLAAYTKSPEPYRTAVHNQQVRLPLSK